MLKPACHWISQDTQQRKVGVYYSLEMYFWQIQSAVKYSINFLFEIFKNAMGKWLYVDYEYIKQ